MIDYDYVPRYSFKHAVSLRSGKTDKDPHFTSGIYFSAGLWCVSNGFQVKCIRSLTAFGSSLENICADFRSSIFFYNTSPCEVCLFMAFLFSHEYQSALEIISAISITMQFLLLEVCRCQVLLYGFVCHFVWRTVEAPL